MVRGRFGRHPRGERERMKLTPWYLVALAPIAVAGCSGAFFGHCAVLAVTLCIFIGTLTVGSQARGPAATETSDIHKLG